MGVLEKESRKRTKRQQIQKIILTAVAVAGIVTVAALAPAALQALGAVGIGKKGKFRYSIENSRKRLVEHGMLEYNTSGLLRLTDKGRAKLRQLELCDYKTKKPKRWDKKWRVLIFDIREERRPLRDKVRRTLVAIGFVRLQDSVWVYPYDCEDLITMLKADFKIGKDILYIIADKLEYDSWLKKVFGVK